jgi:dynein heavy chain
VLDVQSTVLLLSRCCRYPVDYHESLNTVLCQELVRFNRLIVTMHSSLVQLQKAIKGERLIAAAGPA